MQRSLRDDLVRTFLAINALLREEMREVRCAIETRELKYNPRWAQQPRAPRGVQEGGQWIDGEAAQLRPTQRPIRRPPTPLRPRPQPARPPTRPQPTAPRTPTRTPRVPRTGPTGRIALPGTAAAAEAAALSTMVRWSPFLAAATLSGDTPRPTISIAPIPGTDDLFLIDTQYPGRRFVNFARRINARLPGFVTFLGVNTGMRTTIEREFDYLNVAITIEDDHVVFDPRELAREYGRDIPELSTPAPERSPLRIIPITPEEHQLEFALRRLQTPEWQIAYALQQLRNRESDNDADHVAYLRRRGANQWEIERVIRELRNARRARPYQPPTSGELLESFPGLADAPPSTRVFPREDWVDAVPLEVAADEARARTAADNILSEIRAIDPSYSPPTLNAANFPTTMEGRIGYISMLRAERAAASFRVRGEVQPLQIETMRFLQTRADVAYEEALALEAAGQLEPDLSPQEARGRHVDETLRREAADFFTSLGLSTDDESIRINRREYITRRTFRRPDVRVADLAIDVSLSDKSPGRRQIRGYFDALFRPRHVAIIRPSQVGRTYLITPPPSRYSR